MTPEEAQQMLRHPSVLEAVVDAVQKMRDELVSASPADDLPSFICTEIRNDEGRLVLVYFPRPGAA